MMQRLLQDVLTIRKRAGPLPVVLLADGAQELWKLFSEHLNTKPYPSVRRTTTTRVVPKRILQVGLDISAQVWPSHSRPSSVGQSKLQPRVLQIKSSCCVNSTRGSVGRSYCLTTRKP